MARVLPHALVTELVIAAFYAVYTELGYGLPEHVYAAALHLELADRGVDARGEMSLEVRYRGREVGRFRADLVIGDSVLVELKCGPRLDPFAMRQLYNYLRCSTYEVGLLLYFGPEPLVRRLDCPEARKRRPSRPPSAAE